MAVCCWNSCFGSLVCVEKYGYFLAEVLFLSLQVTVLVISSGSRSRTLSKCSS